MPININKGETEDTFISRCMSEESESFPDESQRYAVCKSKWDANKISENKAKFEEMKKAVKASKLFSA